MQYIEISSRIFANTVVYGYTQPEFYRHGRVITHLWGIVLKAMMKVNGFKCTINLYHIIIFDSLH